MSTELDRKQFLTWTLGSAGAVLLGCSDDGGTDTNTGGAGAGGMTAGGTGGTGGSGTGGSGAGTGGSGTGGSAAGTGGSTAGSGGEGGASAGAGGDGGSGGMAADACDAMIAAEISMNHNHILEIPLADIMAGATKAYETTGMAPGDHTHWVELTAADFTTLQGGGTVKKYSCSGGDHEYVLSCGVADEMAGAPTCSDECGGAEGDICPDP